MEKIVVLTNPSGEDAILIRCLRVLFPDCDIIVESKGGDNLESERTGPKGFPAQ